MIQGGVPERLTSATGRTTPVRPGGSVPAKSRNPLHDLISAGKMPVVLELHLTERDRLAYQTLRLRHIAHGFELPHLTVLGQHLRQLEVTSGGLSGDEQSLVRKLQVYADLVSAGGVDLLALDDGSRGRDTLDNGVAAALLIGLGVDPARLLANVVARNRQPEQVRRRLVHFADLGVRNALLLTGDLPIGGGTPARFPMDSVGMCELARRMLIEGALPDDFWIAAAGHPNPDADPDGLRTLQKAMAGAKVIITQAIYSVDQFTQWMRTLQQLGVLDRVHVLGEVIPITSGTQLRSIADVPGIRVPGSLIAELDGAQERIEQAAAAGGQDPSWTKQRLRIEGARITRELLHQVRKVPGVTGFYLGCVKGFEAHLELLREAPLLPEHGHDLHKPTRISGAERQRALAQFPILKIQVENLIQESQRRRRRTRRVGRMAQRAWVQALFQILEWPKVPLFGCKKCDHCDLSPDALICPRGCAKQMTHGPCGAPRWVKGRMLCEDTSRECTWAAIRARRERFGVSSAERLEVRAAASPDFYEGKRYSSFLPVLAGQKRGPNWSLAWRAPIARIARLVHRDFKFAAEGDPRDLLTQAASQSEQVLDMLAVRPESDREELLIKLLALVGTPAAWSLIESHLGEFGLPADGTISDLSLREQFQVAEALPGIRKKLNERREPGSAGVATPHCDELLSVIPEGKRLRQGMRRELANGLIAHISSLGVDVTYAESMLESKSVDDFLSALTVLRDELQVSRARLPFGPGGVSVYLHRVHYKHHYHAPIAIQWFVGSRRAALRIDLRQFANVGRFRSHVRSALEKLGRGESESTGTILLEEFKPGLRSICWDFNLEFWKRLREFENATGKNYDASIGGSTDHNLAYARSSARALFDKVHEHQLGGQRLYVLEIGVASTHRARSFVGEFRRICELTGKSFHQDLTYVLADFSEALLASGAADLSREQVSVETVKIDAGNPHAALASYRGRVLHAHLCNVYDNLPSDQALWKDGQWHRIEVRAYLPTAALEELTVKYGLEPSDRVALEQALASLRQGTGDAADDPAHPRPSTGPQNGAQVHPVSVADFLDACRSRLIALGRPETAYVHFWMDLFAALRLDERCVPVPKVDQLLQAGIDGLEHPGEVFARHLSGTSEARVHLNQAALSGFSQLLAVLHPHGTLEIVDLFVQRLEEYHHAFKGPAKYDGSTVNWLNGPLFRAVGEQLGYTVRFQPFRPFDPKSPSVVLLAFPSA